VKGLVLLTWIHNGGGPPILHPKPDRLSRLVPVNGAVAVVVGIMLWLDITIVNVVLVLKVLQQLLHFLLNDEGESECEGQNGALSFDQRNDAPRLWLSHVRPRSLHSCEVVAAPPLRLAWVEGMQVAHMTEKRRAAYCHSARSSLRRMCYRLAQVEDMQGAHTTEQLLQAARCCVVHSSQGGIGRGLGLIASH